MLSINAEKPQLIARTLDGSILEIVHRPHKEPYTDQHRINGKAMPYCKFPHFGNLWVKQPLGGDHLEIHHRGLNLIYDFTIWNRTGDGG